MLSDDSSVRLNLIRFPLIARVVFFHTYASSLNLGTPDALLMPAGIVGELVGVLVARGFTVALFFMLAGFLFFNNFEWSGDNYLRKVRTRVKTLFVPFLFWNLLWLVIIAVAQNLPWTSDFFSGGIPHLTESSVVEWINLLLGIDRHPMAFQFWFVRDLMLMVALVPVFHLLHKTGAVVFCVILGGIWLADIWPENMLNVIPHPQTVFFFYLGSVIAVKKKTPFLLDKYGVFLIIIFLACAVIHAVYNDWDFRKYVDSLGIFAGFLSALYLTKFLYQFDKLRTLFVWLSGTNFFIFACHEPTLEIVQRLILTVWVPTSDTVRLLYFFALPMIYILAAIGLFVLLNRYLPRFTSLITGMRYLKRVPNN